MANGPILPESTPERVGPVRHLPEALRKYPKRGLVLYFRESARGNAGRQKAKMIATMAWLVGRVQLLTDRPIYDQILVVEGSRLSVPRNGLIRAARLARKHRALLVTTDLSRFIRAIRYCRRTNRHAWPTAKEFRRLSELTGGVPLATWELPGLTEDERHSRATRRPGTAGRRRTIDAERAKGICAALGGLYRDWGGRERWGTSVREVAKRFGVSPQAILGMLKKRSPDGRTWREWAIAEAAPNLKQADLFSSPD